MGNPSASFRAEFSASFWAVPSQVDRVESYPPFGTLVREPFLGVGGCITFDIVFTPAAKTRVLHVPSVEAQELRCNSNPSTSRVRLSPPPCGVPSRDGSFGVSTLKGPASLGWSLLTLGARTWVFGRLYLDPPLPSFSDPEGRQVPCLGVCPFSTIKGPAPM